MKLYSVHFVTQSGNRGMLGVWSTTPSKAKNRVERHIESLDIKKIINVQLVKKEKSYE